MANKKTWTCENCGEEDIPLMHDICLNCGAERVVREVDPYDPFPDDEIPF